MDSGSLERWREYFRSANSDIFGIIEQAILVAASDRPLDFKSERGRIAELLFSCKVTDFESADSGGGEGSEKSGIEVGDEMVEEVIRMKGVVDDVESDESMLLDSLRKLQQMPLSVDALKATGIGFSVNGLVRKQQRRIIISNEIRSLGRKLIEGWKRMVDSWLDAQHLKNNNHDQPPTALPIEAVPVLKRPNGPDVQKNDPMPKSQVQVDKKLNQTSMNFETAKRKLQQSYQEAANAKKQRSIQLVDLSDLPKQSVGQQTRPANANHNRKINAGRVSSLRVAGRGAFRSIESF